MAAPTNPRAFSINACRLAPLAAFVLAPALLVRAHYVLVAPDAAHLWPWAYYGDTRSWWKAAAVVGIGLWMALHALCRLGAGWRPAHRRFGLMAAAAVAATLVSALASEYPRTAWLGYTTLYEGAPVLVAYALAAWYAAEMADSGGARRFLLRCVGAVGLVNAALGILEGTGRNIWESALGRWLMDAPAGVTYVFSALRMAYGTQYQPNHYGMFMAMTTVLSLGMAFAEERRCWKGFWLAGFLTGLAAVIFSYSRTALAVCFGLCLVYGLYEAVRWLRSAAVALREWRDIPNWRVAVICLVVVCGLAAEALSTGRLARAARASVARLHDTFAAPGPAPDIEAVELRDNVISARVRGKNVSVSAVGDDGWLLAVAGEAPSRLTPPADDAGAWRSLVLPGAERATFAVRADGNALLAEAGATLRFFRKGNRVLAVDRKGIPQATVGTVPAASLGGWERYLGGRGYLWTRALPRVADAPWFGHGPGAFAMAFPNDDLWGKERFLDGEDGDKGHGIWLTWLVQLGLVGLLAYALPVGYALYRLVRRPGRLTRPLAAAAVAYVLCSLTNDSTVGVTPIFCVLIGLAVAETAGCDEPGMKRP